ncbi:GIY-YIG nuclease family protein [Bacillus sp. T3]|uniref:GIY-YIG nuclease family protein n=1 Tax=Bacillus sp. T3 TaxID=467262 RepID=UPI003996C3E2
MTLQEKVKNLPSSPGVYLMKNSAHTIIYVGKAKQLKRRVQSYFQNTKHHSPKTINLVKNIKDFDYILTDTEFEAFMLECQLIHEIKPHFNRKMKNTLAYTYIVIKAENGSRKIVITNQPVFDEGGICFGPYPSKGVVERAVQAFKDFYKINCSNPTKRNSTCLNFSLGLCIGMCMGGPAVELYEKILDRLIGLLSGDEHSIIGEVELRMNQAANDYDFETAAKYRDTLELINYLLKREKIIEFTSANQSIAVIEHLEDTAFKLFLIKRNKIILNKKLEMTSIKEKRTRTKLLKELIANIQACPAPASTTISQDEIDEAQIIYSYLNGSSCTHIVIPEEAAHHSANSNNLQQLLEEFIPK